MSAALDFQREDLNHRVAATGSLNGLIPHLFTNNYSPDIHTQISDLTEATFDGYAAGAAVVWGPAYNDEVEGQAECAALVAPFIATDDTITDTIFGMYLTAPAGLSPLGVTLAYALAFDTPITVSRAGDGVSIGLTVGYDGKLTAVVNG